MSGIAIYLEGGGDGKDSKAEIRQGMDAFLEPLKNAARRKALRWKVVACGGRDRAFAAFQHARQLGDMSIVVLLVDSEEGMTTSPCAHLSARDRWDMSGVPDVAVHLMTQTMEAWIVADGASLAEYYGQHFQRNALPAAQNLELVPKADIENALKRATRRTQKGEYHKIRHGGSLLKRVDRAKAQQRCPNCSRLFNQLGQQIANA